MDFEITDNVLWTTKGYGNSSAVNLGDKVIVIDAMLNYHYAKEWRDIVENHFKRKVDYLFLTHHHGDHIFGNQSFIDIPIISTESTYQIIKNNKKNLYTPDNLKEYKESNPEYSVEGLEITLPSITFDNKLIIHGKNKVAELIKTDGHCLGSSYLWIPKSKALIAGDLIFNRMFPYGADPTCDLVKWQKAIEKFIELKPKLIISGHGVIARNEDLKLINTFLSNTVEFLAIALEEGKTFEAIISDENLPDYYSEDRQERKNLSYQNWFNQFKSVTE